ncbi:MAG TPA: type II toxin-antitoxin system RelE/ParE family toxin [Thermoanaerobaculia bacterium]|jgi:plasmid stabilization system protein ParE|nr:type II toxin-antitoxin system RelE/ParE family toxin [Thermoanaerobaculia bacterium]
MVARQPPGGTGLFRQKLTRGFDFITTQPEIGTKALDTSLLGVRRLHLTRIRYYLYYRIQNDDTAEVVALWHTSRGQGPSIQG